jgi:predicted aspartyl protease
MKERISVEGADLRLRVRLFLNFALMFAMLMLPARFLFAVSCPVVKHNPPTDADKALLAADYAKAESLYIDTLTAHPGDVDATVGLVHAFLRERKLKNAEEVIKDAFDANSGTAPASGTANAPVGVANQKLARLLTVRGEIEFREGEPWLVEPTVVASYKLDPCNPRTRLLFARLAFATSRHATARQQIAFAHEFDPDDPEIRVAWMNTLPLKEQIPAMEAYIASGAITDPDKFKSQQTILDLMKKLAEEPPKLCRLASGSAPAEIPLEDLIQERKGILATTAYALAVDINDHHGLLQMDTGASGLSISKSLADHAGLKSSSAATVRGIGDEGPQHGYRAYADSIKIGGLEFKDCSVTVLEKAPADRDGLIGTDVFGAFLVTIDYPFHRLKLDSLPPHPGQTTPVAPSLSTTNADTPEPERDAPGSGTAAAGEPAPSKPQFFDRYIAPEMKDYLSIYRVGHSLIIPGSLHPPDVKLFLLDTGAWSTSVSPEAAREVTKVDLNTNMTIAGLNGKVEHGYVAQMLDIRFGGISKHELGVPAFSLEPSSSSVGMELSGLLGADILEELTIHIDYRDGLIKFEYDPKRGYHPQNH